MAALDRETGGTLIPVEYGDIVIDSAVVISNPSDDAVDVMTSVVTGPLVEEIGKGIGVLALVLAAHKVLDRPAQGGVLGALVGFGFARGEDVGYYVSALEDGISGLWQSFLARALLGAYGHAIFAGVPDCTLAWAMLHVQNAFAGLLAATDEFVAAPTLHTQANGIGFLAPEDSWNLTYDAVEVLALIMNIALPVWGLHRRRSTPET